MSPRPAPRRLAARPAGDFGIPLSRIQWDRFGRVALVVVFFIVVVMYVQPTLKLFHHYEGSKAEHAEFSRLHQRNRALRHDLKALDTRGGLEAAGRRAGMVREDERAYVIR